ncbi:hypothetical protein OKW23_001230 [Bacilli bacterium PM5-9]|nr:hypothetical protein [Bacilli bacterium PM5-9]
MKNKVSRGFLTEEILNENILLSTPILIKQLHIDNPSKRSAAINILSKRSDHDYDQYIDTILEMLKHEKSLYTRLEITSVLEKGNETTIKKMINYLGEIGCNQHKILPNVSSKKKSYPLARDLIARTLAKTNPTYIDSLFNVLNSNDVNKIREVIDAIGYQVFYNPQLASKQRYQTIINTINLYKDEIIMWKCLTCLSAFKLNDCYNYLTTIKNDTTLPEIIRQEATRSLNIIK